MLRARGYLRSEFERRNSGAVNAGSVLVLDEGIQVKPLSMSAEDAELIASRRFGGEELARLFNVPPPLVGQLEFGSYSNVETMGRYLSQFCLAPWARRIEAEFARSVFLPDDPHHLMIDLAGLQRGDEAGRWATYGIAIDKGILTVNEVRAGGRLQPAARFGTRFAVPIGTGRRGGGNRLTAALPPPCHARLRDRGGPHRTRTADAAPDSRPSTRG